MATRSEVNSLIARALALPDLEKFEVFNALREELASSFSEEKPENKLIQERKEALAYIGKAAKHLGLGGREAPTKRQFDEVAKELGWKWSGTKIQRAWERWWMATEAYLGTRRIRTPEARERANRLRGAKGKTVELHLAALSAWQATKPKIETHAAYDEFADAHNANLPKGKIPFARASTIARGLPVSWPNAIRIARKETTLKKAAEQELAETLPEVLDEKTLVGLPQVSRILSVSAQVASELAKQDPHFPVAVAHFDGHAAWLYEDLKLYRRKLATPNRAEDEYQRLFVSLSELLIPLKRKEQATRRAIRKRAWGRVPQPEGELGVGIYYWRRQKVEAWFARGE